MPIGEVAGYLTGNEGTIHRLAAAKKTPAFEVDGSWRSSKIDIDVRIKEQSTVDTGSTAADGQ